MISKLELLLNGISLVQGDKIIETMTIKEYCDRYGCEYSGKGTYKVNGDVVKCDIDKICDRCGRQYKD